MKGLWGKLTNFVSDWHQALIVGVLGILMIGGMYFQSTIHDVHIHHLQKIHSLETELYKQKHIDILKAGDTLYKAYQQEKVNSQIKDQILNKQRIIIEDLIKKIEEYKKWENVDPKSIA